mmetsp:Transcript_16478/g.41928  ORF Transcript_16478/g.41928 Transcript_16478/m.41928 type:complete len:96 (+) Transcript_16478:630-917(+)
MPPHVPQVLHPHLVHAQRELPHPLRAAMSAARSHEAAPRGPLSLKFVGPSQTPMVIAPCHVLVAAGFSKTSGAEVRVYGWLLLFYSASSGCPHSL